MRSVAWAAEGAGGGPLSAAAEAFARAGRHPYRRIPTPSDTGHSLRTVARLTAVLSAGSGGTAAGSLALLAGLAALARALADLREAQQRAHQVAAARRAVEQLRTVAPPRRADPTRPGGRDDDPRTRRGRDRSDRSTRDRRRPSPGVGDLKPPPRTGGWTRRGRAPATAWKGRGGMDQPVSDVERDLSQTLVSTALVTAQAAEAAVRMRQHAVEHRRLPTRAPQPPPARSVGPATPPTGCGGPARSTPTGCAKRRWTT